MKRLKCWWLGHVIRFNKTPGTPDYMCVACGEEMDYPYVASNQAKGVKWIIAMWLGKGDAHE